ncbi:MAG: hypothetical protein GY775_06355 [Candidatus Scalindua sp.]|nr:hypothetical protein [Candidatus Scalindua sp.]
MRSFIEIIVRSKVDTDKIIEYRKQNKSIRQIASEMNLPKGAIQRTLEMCSS